MEQLITFMAQYVRRLDIESLEPKQEERNLGRDEILLKRLDKLQVDMRVMHFQNNETAEENARMLDAYDEALNNITEQMQYFKSNCAQKPQEAYVEDGGTNNDDREPCSVVTLWSGKQLGAQKNKELIANKAVKDDDDEAQKDEG